MIAGRSSRERCYWFTEGYIRFAAERHLLYGKTDYNDGFPLVLFHIYLGSVYLSLSAGGLKEKSLRKIDIEDHTEYHGARYHIIIPCW